MCLKSFQRSLEEHWRKKPLTVTHYDHVKATKTKLFLFVETNETHYNQKCNGKQEREESWKIT